MSFVACRARIGADKPGTRGYYPLRLAPNGMQLTEHIQIAPSTNPPEFSDRRVAHETMA
jgi:hypothetical protein